MEELALIIPLLASIFSIAVSIMNKKKKEQKPAWQAQDNLQEAIRQEAEKMKIQKQEQQKQDNIWNQPAAAAYTPVKIPVPARMNGEGKDDCHAYMLDEDEAASVSEEKTDEEKQQAAQDLLRGVILSEILQRPRPLGGRRRA